jgi:hypothetical protein
MQGTVENVQREAQRLRQERGKFEAEASAALQDAREALARESEVQEQLQKADRVPCLFFPFPMFCFNARRAASTQAHGRVCIL